MTKGTSSYRIKDETAIYFLSISTVEWIDVFTRKSYKDIIVDSLSYCQDFKGLLLYAWVIMSNHIHLVVQAKDGYLLSAIIRDFKKFTSKQIIKVIQEEEESRKDWLLFMMRKAGRQNSKKQRYQLWRNDNHPIELYTNVVIDQKIDDIHQNPVVENIVLNEEEYVYSSIATAALLKLDEL